MILKIAHHAVLYEHYNAKKWQNRSIFFRWRHFAVLSLCVTGLPPSGLDGAAEADAGGGHRRQEGAGTRTLRQVPLLIQTDKYAHQFIRQCSIVTRVTRVEVRSAQMSLQTESGILIICYYLTHMQMYSWRSKHAIIQMDQTTCMVAWFRQKYGKRLSDHVGPFSSYVGFLDLSDKQVWYAHLYHSCCTVLRNRNYYLRFRSRLLTSYGSGSDFWQVTVPVPLLQKVKVPAVPSLYSYSTFGQKDWFKNWFVLNAIHRHTFWCIWASTWLL